MSVPMSQLTTISSAPTTVNSMGSPSATIGGTSGGSGQGAGANVLSMNLGGVNVNYDMGPSTGEASNEAYNFLDNSFSADTALLGNTIIGSQNFLSGMTTPVLNMAQNQQSFNTQVLPSMFQTLNAQNASIGSEAVGAESNVALASVNASSAATQQASSGGGFCFVTTAVCEARSEPDNGPTLTKLRAFRDGFMQETPHRRALVLLYYKTAPELVRRIQARSDAREFLNSLHDLYIHPACIAIDHGRNLEALTLYIEMLFAVKREA